MKKSFFLFLFLSSATLGFGQKNREKSVENVTVKDFTKIRIELAAKVFIRQADSFSCRIEGKQRHIDEVQVTADNGTLRVKLHDKREWFDEIERVTVFITAPNFEEIEFSGAGQLVADNKLTGNKLKLEASGAGSVEIQNVDYQHIDIDMSGVGNISVAGKTVSATMEMSGTGNIDAFDLHADSVRCETSGVGNINCYANEELNAQVSGIGGVRYKGTPKSLRKSVSGIGKVMNRN